MNEENILLLMICEERLISIVKNALREVMLELKKAEPKEDTPEWINSKEVCKLLGISKSTLVNYRKRNVITSHKLQGKLMFEYAEIFTKINKIKQFESVSAVVH